MNMIAKRGLRPLRTVALLAALAAPAGLVACAYNEELGRQQVLLVDPSALSQQGAQAWAQMKQTSRLSTDAAANARLRRIGGQIVGASGLGGQTWEYAVFQDNSVNAFVLPGGKVGVTTGMMAFVANDDELAAVLGHEVAHVMANHAAERYSQSALAQVGAGLVGAATQGAENGLAQSLGRYAGPALQVAVLNPYSRQHELEADRIGLDLMVRAGFSARRGVELWRRMAARGGSSMPAILSTHPSDAARVQQLDAYIAARGYS
ncbi:M48 family metallopeptidase [Phenylobacterium sp.]|uniref:M48 family metallopeptidase n=1 Tax=Phenylobacterium sp. TaxID=1871053 RepID=UPI0027306D69|nr:M48 family metallopeptidase [Phenylobacterium sp.]MDP1873321.1 M48 family metallopeptidase [Phenylobacterium sp.]MDP3489300.1 M48 family metallopeptidase [Phenylobacterium sp.]